MDGLALSRSPARTAFAHFLRTGFYLADAAFEPVPEALETKFNPYHDPTNGQFTSGPASGAGQPANDGIDPSATPALFDGVYQAGDDPISLLQPIAGSEPPRGFGDNSGGFFDPMSLEQVFPGLETVQGGSILAVADDILNLSGPASGLTSRMSLDYSSGLLADIKSVDPHYRFDTFGFPDTFDGQMRQINDLRWDRAAAIYRVRGDAGPMQVEALRYLQAETDTAYDEARSLAAAGRLPPAPTERMAIGNYVDLTVKESLRQQLATREISTQSGQPVRVNGREYDSSGTDLTHSVPDARVGDAAFDVTLWRKTPGTKQITRFFGSDFKPNVVVIVRPSQLGHGNTYIIKRPGR